jgi:hypothetical protein
MRLRPKVIERGPGYRIIAFPIWATEVMIAKAVENVRKDAKVQGRELKIEVGHRLVRVDMPENSEVR